MQFHPSWRFSTEFGWAGINGFSTADNLLEWGVLTGLVTCISVVGMSLLSRRDAARLNLCPKCNYDRAGLAAGAKCPECGSAAP
jgi:hypothetical protein